MNTTTNTREVSDAMRDAVAKAIADVIGHGMREKCYAHADAAIDALSAAQPAERVPEGWVLVPREPTEEMLEATRKCVASTLVNMSIRRTIYRAMLAASPATSPARGDGGEG